MESRILLHKGTSFEVNSKYLLKKSDVLYTITNIDVNIDKISSYLYLDTSVKILRTISNPNSLVYALQSITPKNYELSLCGTPLEETKYSPSVSGGSGSFGNVDAYPVQNIVTKKFSNELKDGQITEDAVKEIAIYKYLQDTFCTPKMYDFDCHNNSIVVEKGESFDKYLHTIRDVYSMRKLMFRLLKIMCLVSSKGIIHCDLKPSNLIVKPDGNIYVIDWGLAEIDRTKNQQKIKYSVKQTIWWRSPELLCDSSKIKQQYSYKIDIFSLGIIFIELYNKIVGGITPDPDTIETYIKHRLLNILLCKDITVRDDIDTIFYSYINKGECYNIIKQSLLTHKNFIYRGKHMPEPMADLISHMLEFNPKNRWNYNKLLIHPFFQYMVRERLPKINYNINCMCKINNVNAVWDSCTSTNKDRGINKRMRKIVFEWLRDVACSWKYLDPEVLFLGFQILDLFVLFQKNKIYQHNLQAYACSSMMISSKIYNNSCPIDPEEFVYMCDNSTTSYQLIELEKDILITLQGNYLLMPTLYTYLQSNFFHLLDTLIARKTYLTKLTDLYLLNNIYQHGLDKIDLNSIIN